MRNSARRTASGRAPSGAGLFEQLQADVQGFRDLAEVLKQMAGISLPENPKNLSLMASRLHGVIADRDLETYREFRELIRQGDVEARKDFLHALTTNTTQFFREFRHFDLLREYLPGLLASQKGKKELRVWCAAASTGQEPYTLAMTLLEAIPDAASWDIRFLSTDIDENVLAVAGQGVYAEKEMGGIPAHLLKKYFRAVEGASGRSFQVTPALRKLIRFGKLNLLGDYPFKHKFDIIFCRNVLIYFERDTVAKVVQKLSAALAPEGYLFVGHSETGAIRLEELDPVSSAVYRKRESSR